MKLAPGAIVSTAAIGDNRARLTPRRFDPLSDPPTSLNSGRYRGIQSTGPSPCPSLRPTPRAVPPIPLRGSVATRRRRTPFRAKPFWERGYKSHGYWLGKSRIGFVEVSTGKPLEMKYHWQAGTHAGQATTLRDAKRLVEQTILMGGRQLILFADEPLILSPTR